MCYALFIGSDAPLTVEDAIDAEDRFHLEESQPEHAPVMAHFSKCHVYYAASWQGCGCGWYPDTLLFERPSRRKVSREQTRQCLSDLSDLLDQLLRDQESVELFLTWRARQASRWSAVSN